MSTFQFAILLQDARVFFCFLCSSFGRLFGFQDDLLLITKPNLPMDQAKTSAMTCLQRNTPVARVLISIAEFRGWLARAEPGEWLEYYRGLLALDRVRGVSSLKEAERRKLVAVADHASALAGRGKLHLLQERHGHADYSYWAIARAPARPIEQAPVGFPIDQHSEHPRP